MLSTQLQEGKQEKAFGSERNVGGFGQHSNKQKKSFDTCDRSSDGDVRRVPMCDWCTNMLQERIFYTLFRYFLVFTLTKASRLETESV